MIRGKSRVAVLALLAALALPAACERPTHDAATLRAVDAEARSLMAAHPRAATLARTDWPPAIASLAPEDVEVLPEGVDIAIRRSFDGGWGYFVPRRPGTLPEPRGRFEPAGEGIYWWHPY